MNQNIFFYGFCLPKKGLISLIIGNGPKYHIAFYYLYILYLKDIWDLHVHKKMIVILIIRGWLN